jgi:hypothetical protein
VIVTDSGPGSASRLLLVGLVGLRTVPRYTWAGTDDGGVGGDDGFDALDGPGTGGLLDSAFRSMVCAGAAYTIQLKMNLPAAWTPRIERELLKRWVDAGADTFAGGGA